MVDPDFLDYVLAPGFKRIGARANMITGEMVQLDPPVEMHTADIDRWVWSWVEIDRIDWEIEQAARALAVCCVCGSPDFVYRNYLDLPFCCGCAACCAP